MARVRLVQGVLARFPGLPRWLVERVEVHLGEGLLDLGVGLVDVAHLTSSFKSGGPDLPEDALGNYGGGNIRDDDGVMVESAELQELFRSAVATGRFSRLQLFDAVDFSDAGMHPQFDLMEVSERADDYDPGYTENPYRGEHLTIPCVAEDGELFTIEVSSHKGTIFVDLVRVVDAEPGAVAAVGDALWPLAEGEERVPHEGSEVVGSETGRFQGESSVGIEDHVAVDPGVWPKEQSVDEVFELAAKLQRYAGAVRSSLSGVRPRLQLSSMYHELRRLEEGLGEMVSQLAVVADLVAHDPPLAATFPDGREADGVLSPKQLAYLESLAPAAERTVRYSELLAATSELPKQEQYVLDHRAIEDSLARAMQSTCPRCGSGPGEFCRTLGGKNPGRETSIHSVRGSESSP